MAGVPTVLRRYDGMIHDFFLFGDMFEEIEAQSTRRLRG